MRAFDRDLIRAGSNVGRGLQRGRIIMQVVRIGLDLAKYVFEVHGVDVHGNVVIRKTLRRGSVATFFANLPTKPEHANTTPGIRNCSSNASTAVPKLSAYDNPTTHRHKPSGQFA
jgi:hypothetical protein